MCVLTVFAQVTSEAEKTGGRHSATPEQARKIRELNFGDVQLCVAYLDCVRDNRATDTMIIGMRRQTRLFGPKCPSKGQSFTPISSAFAR